MLPTAWTDRVSGESLANARCVRVPLSYCWYERSTCRRCRSLKTITWSRHSRRIEPIHMIEEERSPALRRRSPWPRHILRNGGLADVDVELEEFSMDAGSAPERVGEAHLPD